MHIQRMRQVRLVQRGVHHGLVRKRISTHPDANQVAFATGRDKQRFSLIIVEAILFVLVGVPLVGSYALALVNEFYAWAVTVASATEKYALAQVDTVRLC